MLRHDHIAEDTEIVTHPHGFQRALEKPAGARYTEARLPSVTTEGDEMGIA